MKFVQIKYPDVKLLQQFIDEAGTSLKSFRYFQNRPLEIIKNHLCSFLLLDEEEPVAYGHLDKEKETIWLGIAVSEKHIGIGLGVIMMNQLITFAKQNKVKEIKLSVDNDNISAIKLYEKLGFKLTKQKETFGLYLLQLN